MKWPGAAIFWNPYKSVTIPAVQFSYLKHSFAFESISEKGQKKLSSNAINQLKVWHKTRIRRISVLKHTQFHPVFYDWTNIFNWIEFPQHREKPSTSFNLAKRRSSSEIKVWCGGRSMEKIKWNRSSIVAISICTSLIAIANVIKFRLLCRLQCLDSMNRNRDLRKQ